MFQDNKVNVTGIGSNVIYALTTVINILVCEMFQDNKANVTGIGSNVNFWVFRRVPVRYR